MKRWNKRWLAVLVCSGMGLSTGWAAAETCVTQSQMLPPERDTLASAARTLAAEVQSNDQAGLLSTTIPEVAANFNGIRQTVSNTAPNLAGDAPQVDEIYVLDATANKLNSDGSAPDADFFCTLNKGSAEADFSISGLPPGRYGFAMVQFEGKSPWLVSMLLRQDGAQAPWKLAGLFPKPSSAAGHDGLWYWSQGRAMAAKGQSWTAYIDYQEAWQLLQPALFVSSTHLENLRAESASAAPAEVANGISTNAPLVIKGADGTQYRFSAIGPDNTLHNDKLDVAAHLMVDSWIQDPVAVRKRDFSAMSALLSLHPELRQSFHGVWIFSEAPGKLPMATEGAMNDIH